MSVVIQDTGRKRALVTGAANGLGKAITLQLAAQGYEVVAVDNDTGNLFALHDESDGIIIGMDIDLGRADSLGVHAVRIAASGPFDLVFMVAGVSATGCFEKIPADTHDRLMIINTLAPIVLASKLAGGAAMKRNSMLVFVSSLSNALGYPGAASYAASKDAIAIYAKSVRRPFAKIGIRVCCVFPGPIRTNHADRHSPAGARDTYRMPPSRMAGKIIAAARKGRAVYYPGFAAKIARWSARLFPGRATAQVRKVIFEKLDGEVF